MEPHIRHNISPVAWSSSSKLGTRCYIGAVSSSRKCCRPFVRCLVDYDLVRRFRILREASEMPPYAMAINRPRHLARIPLENLSSNTSRAWPVRAKPSPRFSPAKPGDDQQTKPPRTIASPSAEFYRAPMPYNAPHPCPRGAYLVQACESPSAHTQIDHRKDGAILAYFGYELAMVPRGGIHRPWFLPLKAA